MKRALFLFISILVAKFLCAADFWPSVIENEIEFQAPTDREEPEEPKKRKRLPQGAVRLLKAWFTQHIDKPYPTDEEKASLARKGNITETQVANWFTNQRRRNLSYLEDMRKKTQIIPKNKVSPKSEEPQAKRRRIVHQGPETRSKTKAELAACETELECGRSLQNQDRLQPRRRHPAIQGHQARLVEMARLRGARGPATGMVHL